jgi:hypothetical protein
MKGTYKLSEGHGRKALDAPTHALIRQQVAASAERETRIAAHVLRVETQLAVAAAQRRRLDAALEVVAARAARKRKSAWSQRRGTTGGSRLAVQA